MANKYVEEHVEVLRVKWFHECGGELVSDPSTFQMVQIGQNAMFRTQFVHTCKGCGVNLLNKHSYPRMVAKGSPLDIM